MAKRKKSNLNALILLVIVLCGVAAFVMLFLNALKNSQQAINASTVIAIQQKQEGLQLKLVKSRNAKMGTKLIYMWDADVGTFEYIPQPARGEEDEEKAEDLRRRYNDKESEEY